MLHLEKAFSDADLTIMRPPWPYLSDGQGAESSRMRSPSRILTIAAIQLFVLLAFVTGAFAIETTPTPIYADEFSAFDSTTWAKTNTWGAKCNPGANELEYYDPANTFTQGGVLRFLTESRSMNGYDYTSGIISSLNRPKFQYGYFEMRGKLPKGQGYWPAFWLTNDRGSEIDIFEMLGHEPNRLHFTVHHTHDGNHHDHGVSATGPDYSQGFHTYAVDWQPTYIKWYVDGRGGLELHRPHPVRSALDRCQHRSGRLGGRAELDDPVPPKLRHRLHPRVEEHGGCACCGARRSGQRRSGGGRRRLRDHGGHEACHPGVRCAEQRHRC